MSLRSWIARAWRFGPRAVKAVLAAIRPRRSPPSPVDPVRIALFSSPRADAGAVADFPLDLARSLFDREGLARADIAIRGGASRKQSAHLAERLTGKRFPDLESDEEFDLFAAKRPPER